MNQQLKSANGVLIWAMGATSNTSENTRDATDIAAAMRVCDHLDNLDIRNAVRHYSRLKSEQAIVAFFNDIMAVRRGD
jgi:3-dehydroquinate dehydratase